MRLTKRQLKRIIREEKRRINESMKDMHSELTNIVFDAAQIVAEEYAEITVDDVMREIEAMDDVYIAEYGAEALGSRVPGDMFVEFVRNMTYEEVVDHMQEFVSMGELADGYEDIYTMPGM